MGAFVSTVAWAAPTGTYVVVALWLWRQFAWRIAWKEARFWSHPHRIDGGNVSVGIMLGFLQAMFWPLTLFIVRGIETETFYGFLREPGTSRRERQLREREAHIAALEKELKIGE